MTRHLARVLTLAAGLLLPAHGLAQVGDAPIERAADAREHVELETLEIRRLEIPPHYTISWDAALGTYVAKTSSPYFGSDSGGGEPVAGIELTGEGADQSPITDLKTCACQRYLYGNIDEDGVLRGTLNRRPMSGAMLRVEKMYRPQGEMIMRHPSFGLSGEAVNRLMTILSEQYDGDTERMAADILSGALVVPELTGDSSSRFFTPESGIPGEVAAPEGDEAVQTAPGRQNP